MIMAVFVIIFEVLSFWRPIVFVDVYKFVRKKLVLIIMMNQLLVHFSSYILVSDRWFGLYLRFKSIKLLAIQRNSRRVDNTTFEFFVNRSGQIHSRKSWVCPDRFFNKNILVFVVANHHWAPSLTSWLGWVISSQSLSLDGQTLPKSFTIIFLQILKQLIKLFWKKHQRPFFCNQSHAFLNLLGTFIITQTFRLNALHIWLWNQYINFFSKRVPFRLLKY